jgi:hypothetical protein
MNRGLYLLLLLLLSGCFSVSKPIDNQVSPDPIGDTFPQFEEHVLTNTVGDTYPPFIDITSTHIKQTEAEFIEIEFTVNGEIPLSPDSSYGNVIYKVWVDSNYKTKYPTHGGGNAEYVLSIGYDNHIHAWKGDIFDCAHSTGEHAYEVTIDGNTARAKIPLPLIGNPSSFRYSYESFTDLQGKDGDSNAAMDEITLYYNVPTSQSAETLAPSPEPSRTASFAPKFTQTFTPEVTPWATSTSISLQIPATTPTAISGWRTYINEYLGYQFDYPSSATIHEDGYISIYSNETIPDVFISPDEYFSYLYKVLPDNLCVSIESSGGWITIKPPDDSIGQFMGTCPGMGLGVYSRMEDSVEVFEVDGQSYSIPGKTIYQNAEKLGTSLYFLYIKNFRVTIVSRPEIGMTPEMFLEHMETLKKILSTLIWTKTPDLTIPGTTCAGKFTQLVPSVWAQVSPGGVPNRVRSGPNKADEFIANIYPGTIVRIIEGPVCADGLIFWKVENNSIPGGVGWTAEGNSTDYYLLPYVP